MASRLERDVRRFRRQLRRGGRASILFLADTYSRAWDRIQRDSDALIADIADARAAGQTVNASWLRQQSRYESLQRQIEIEVTRFSREAAGRIETDRITAIRGGSQEATMLIESSLGRIPPGVNVNINRLPTEAIRDLVANLQRTAPLGELLADLPDVTRRRIEDGLIDGLAKGRHPRRIARDMRHAGHMPLRRAQTIARTEVFRAYRSSSMETYRQNSHLLEGHVWYSQLDDRTCLGCWYMHGTLLETDEMQPSHVSCRCTSIPRTKSWSDLGYDGIPDTRPQIESGRDIFERLPAERKATILGPSKYKAYRDGDITFDDLAGFRDDPTWGRSVQERSLKSIVGLERSEEIIASIR